MDSQCKGFLEDCLWVLFKSTQIFLPLKTADLQLEMDEAQVNLEPFTRTGSTLTYETGDHVFYICDGMPQVCCESAHWFV